MLKCHQLLLRVFLENETLWFESVFVSVAFEGLRQAPVLLLIVTDHLL
jgi:hypothetical protein